MLLLGLVAVLVLLWPGDALAWGPVTHLVHGSRILDSLSILGPALQEMLREHRLAYLYGCVAADIVQAKKYTRSLYTHCHCWPVGWQIVETARASGSTRSRSAISRTWRGTSTRTTTSCPCSSS
jgi:hypothetical protein